MSIVPSMSDEAKREVTYQKFREDLKNDPDREPYLRWKKMVAVIDKPIQSVTSFALEFQNTPEKRVRFLLRSMKK